MTEDTPLIAGEAHKQATTGAGAIDNLYLTGDKLADGNWAEGMLNGAAGSVAIAGVAADPLAGLAAAGFGWLMEHFDFLKEPLDALTGDQQAIDAMSSTWANVGQEVQSASADLTNAVKRDTASWDGEAADAYRAFAEDKAASFAAIASGCTAAGTAVKMCGTLLSIVRDIVRDLISQAVGEVVAAGLEWLAAEGLTFGFSTPAMITDLCRRALKWANKISEWTKRVTGWLKRCWDRLDEFGSAVQKLKSFLEKAASQSPVGKDNKLTRRQIGEQGMGKGSSWSAEIDNSSTAGNKFIGKAKTDVAKAAEGEYVTPSEPKGKKDEQDPNRYTYGNS